MPDNTLETILKFSTQNGEAVENLSGGLTDLEKTIAGTRTTIGNLSSDMTIFGTNVGTASDFLSGMGISLPTSYMQAFGMALKATTDFMADAIQGTVDYAFQVRELSRTIGATPEEASKLIQAADDVVVSYEEMSAAMNIAIRNGISPTIEGMGELSDQYLAIESPIERTRFLLDTFGRSGAALAPLMELGSEGIRELGDEAEATGLVLDEDAIRATREYEIAMDGLGDTLDGLKTQMALELIPAINMDIENLMMLFDIVGQVTEQVNGLNEETKDQIQNFANMGGPVTALIASLVIVDEETEDLVDTTGTLNATMSGSKDAIGAAKEAAIAYNEAITESDVYTEELYITGGSLVEGFDAQRIANELLTTGIRAFNLTLLDSKQFELDLAYATGQLTEEDYNLYSQQLDNLAALEALNAGVEAGAISQEEYTQALADGKVTRDEVYQYLLSSSLTLAEIQAIMGNLDGTVIDVGVTVGVTGPGAGLISDPNWQPGQTLDPGEIGALGALDLGGGAGSTTPGGGRGAGMGDTYNYTLNIYTSAPVEDIAAQFELLMRISEGG